MAQGICSIEGCEGKAGTRGWCSHHYQRWYRHGDPLAPPGAPLLPGREKPACTVEGCSKISAIDGMCRAHDAALRPDRTKRRSKDGLSPIERMWTRINRAGPIPEFRPDLGPCWIFEGQINDAGYGIYSDGTRMVRVHRTTYESENGPIMEGFQIDHLCRVTACCRPSHLEAVTPAENLRRSAINGGVLWDRSTHYNVRKTHCKRGHEFTPENTGRAGSGGRRCLECARLERQRRAAAT